MDATASSQTGCSDLTSAPELSPSGVGAAAISPPAFANEHSPFSNSYRISPFAELDAHNCVKPDGVLESKLACRLPLAESLDPADGRIYIWVSDAVCSTLPCPWSGAVRGSYYNSVPS